MKDIQTNDSEWLRWIEAQKQAVQFLMASDFVAAIAEVNAFLGQEPPLDLVRQALGFRGDLRREQGDLGAAREDFMAALELSEEADFERFTLENALGRIAEQLSETAEAERWYLDALKTATEDPTTCGVSALRHLSQLRQSFALSPEERDLAERTVVQGWRVLHLPGEPDLSDLWASARKIFQAQAKPPTDPNHK
jgi:tetratricopeptide (TPR) repeat protein